MLTHELIWGAIDRLAERNGLSASGLARLAGLDPTTFNPSKRIGKNGKQRWPTTESISKVLLATGLSVSDLLAEIDAPKNDNGSLLRLPVYSSTSSDLTNAFDGDGKPAGTNWIVGDSFPVSDPSAFALEVPDGRFQPFFRPGNLIVVSPKAQVRESDLILAHVTRPETSVGVFEVVTRSERMLEVRDHARVNGNAFLDLSDVNWYSRIVFSRM